MSGRNHGRGIKPMEPKLAMGLVGRPTHHIKFFIVLERHRYKWSCAKVVMGYTTLKIECMVLNVGVGGRECGLRWKDTEWIKARCPPTCRMVRCSW
jgi:hypothetical protein